MADLKGISYIRTTREKTPILYTDRLDEFRVGGSRIVRGGGADDQVAVIAAGITVHEAVKAVDSLNGAVKVRLIDLYSVKPIDADAVVAAVRATGGRLVVAEDHWPEGGIGDAVLAALAAAGKSGDLVRFVHLAPRQMPGSGKPAELLAAAGIDAAHIAAAVKDLAA
jgi:transketolase